MLKVLYKKMLKWDNASAGGELVGEFGGCWDQEAWMGWDGMAYEVLVIKIHAHMNKRLGQEPPNHLRSERFIYKVRVCRQ